jgi:hypothetical protein
MADEYTSKNKVVASFTSFKGGDASMTANERITKETLKEVKTPWGFL